MDIEKASRMVPIHSDDKHLLGIQWENHMYIDITLPFGLRCALIIFIALADALQWILYYMRTIHTWENKVLLQKYQCEYAFAYDFILL